MMGGVTVGGGSTTSQHSRFARHAAAVMEIGVVEGADEVVVGSGSVIVVVAPMAVVAAARSVNASDPCAKAAKCFMVDGHNGEKPPRTWRGSCIES